MTSFMKKCETDAAKACDVSAKEKKLAGAAKTSFEKKCVADHSVIDLDKIAADGQKLSAC
jgi:hypothetical protein